MSIIDNIMLIADEYACESESYGPRSVLAEQARQALRQALRTAIEQAEKQESVAQAWDEGYRTGINDERMSEANIGIAGFGANVEPARINPYRAIGQAEKQESVAILPDGSAFGVMSFPLPADHWLYVPNVYRDDEYEPIDLPKPILTHAMRESVVAAVRYAVRGATMRGQEMDFDPDALVQNAVYALCGPYTTPPAAQREWVGLTDEEIAVIAAACGGLASDFVVDFARSIEQAHGITGETK